MNRTTSILIILMCAVLLGGGALWYVQTRSKPITEYVPPMGSENPSTSSTASSGGIKRDDVIKIEKILDEVPFREIKTTEQEYETLGWNRYENKEIGFEIYYPGDWKVSESKAHDTSDEPIYMSISFAPKTKLPPMGFTDSAFGLYVYKKILKERLVILADREWPPVEKLRVNNADAVVVGRYSVEDKHTFKEILFGSGNWTIDFGVEREHPSVYERMFKSFRLLSEK